MTAKKKRYTKGIRTSELVVWFELVGTSGAAAGAVDRELTRIFMAPSTTLSSTPEGSSREKEDSYCTHNWSFFSLTSLRCMKTLCGTSPLLPTAIILTQKCVS